MVKKINVNKLAIDLAEEFFDKELECGVDVNIYTKEDGSLNEMALNFKSNLVKYFTKIILENVEEDE